MTSTTVKKTPFFDAFDSATGDINSAIESLESLKSLIREIDTERSDEIEELIQALQSVVDYGGDDLDQ